MRYNERVEIIAKKQEEYDPETGEYTSKTTSSPASPVTSVSGVPGIGG